MKITGKHISLAIIAVCLLLVGMVSADDYCTAPPSGIITDIEHNGDWYNITITFPACFDCADNGGGYGDVECVPCSLASFRANKTCVIAPGTIQFNDTSTDPGITDYYWMFGDGNTSIDKNPTNLYSFTGAFSINHSTTNSVRVTWENKSNYIVARAPGDKCGSTTASGGSGDGDDDNSLLMVGIFGSVIAALVLIGARSIL
jgi:PKD repeat protein